VKSREALPSLLSLALVEVYVKSREALSSLLSRALIEVYVKSRGLCRVC